MATIQHYIADPEVRRRAWQLRTNQLAARREPNAGHRALVAVGAAGSLPLSLPLGLGDVVVTGEIRHHDALQLARLGCAAVALSHWSSERPSLVHLARRLGERGGIEALVSEADREPFARA